ncbi:MAG: hypothetical protein RBS77_02995 [Candidatus Moranbacteria bacterium]|jgi:hypothetical protein|nr:hypothetical protein [Candidatus Moranbacteria bacterium]
MILEFLSLPFDPSDSDAEIRKIFDDDLARTLWLGIRQGHIVQKNFKKAILACAEVIRPIKDQEFLVPKNYLIFFLVVISALDSELLGRARNFLQKSYYLLSKEKKR